MARSLRTLFFGGIARGRFLSVYFWAGNLVQAVTHFRKSFPSTITADTLKKLGIAPNNESYVINTLRFIGVLDSEGKKTAQATKAFSQQEDDKFSKEVCLTCPGRI